MEVCPNCGELVEELTDEGWCKPCTNLHRRNGNGRSNTDAYDKLEVFLASNADHIEHYMANGSSLNKAIDLLKLEVAPTCLVCGAVIKYGRRDSMFCTKTENCRLYRRRYIYLYQKKGLTKAEALGRVLSQLKNGS